MNREDVIRLAQKAGFDIDRDEFYNYKPELFFTGVEADLQRFAALVVAAEEANANAKFLEWHADVVKLAVLAEREACAVLVDHILKEGGGTYGDAIRERGEDRFEIKEDRIHRDPPGRRVAKAIRARNKE
jgi:hypothetical protein